MMLVSCKPLEMVSWDGVATQNGGGISDQYPMRFVILQKGNKLKGFTHFCMPGDPATFVKMEFKGTRNGDKMKLTETKIIDYTEINGEWLTKDIELKYIDNAGQKIITGTWIAHKNKSINGEILLQTKK